MDDEARRNLHILDEVAKDHQISQRALSERLGVALGLTNLYLKRLIKKGFIKVKGIPGKRYFYYLTPTGFSEKTALSMRYMQFSWRYYQEIRDQWRRCFQQLQKDGVERVVLYGTGEMAELSYLSLRESHLHVIAVVDSERTGANFCGHKVEPLSALACLSYDRVVLTGAASEPGMAERARALLAEEGVTNDRMVGL